MHLSAMLGDAKVRVTCSPEEELPADGSFERLGPAGACAVVAFAQSAQVIMSLALPDLLIATDRAFGGDGEVPTELPAETPHTADLVASEIERLVCEAFAGSLAGLAQPRIDGRAASAKRLVPAESLAGWRMFVLTVNETGKREWVIRLALDAISFNALFATPAGVAAEPGLPGSPASPFAALPLCIEAVIAEFPLSLARLSAIQPGDTIPLCVSREIPLKILETTIGYGSIGSADERVALQLTRAF